MNIYFSGIGGVGIGPLAEIAHDAGYDVIGSDIEESLIVNKLRQRGITVNIGQDGSFLESQHAKQKIDWLVYTSSLPKTHPELALAQKLGIKTSKRDELLALIIQEKNLKLIAIAGTHGKTTTTGMLVWSMQQLNIPVSYSIGTTIKFGPSGKFDPKSEYFVYECDEFDKNFLHFYPYLSIITSIDYDHPDTYPTIQEYNEAFRQFAKQSQSVIAWRDSSTDIINDLDNINLVDTEKANPNIKIAGIHNRKNATLVQICIKELGQTIDTTSILSDFPGTDRRFEKLADGIYTDYGHHPAEIAATLQLAHELSDQIALIYQPHQNIRQHAIKNDYTTQFELATEIYWLPTYLSREDPNLPILAPIDLIQKITNKDQIHIVDFNDQLWQAIQTARKNGKLILFMGAGQVDNWVRQQLAS
jgi:UDP-N-acetylmuramate--alanine ligase